MATFKKYECSFFTATILEWKHLLADDKYKQIIIDSLSFLVKNDRIYVHGFVIMSNHLHLLWHIRSPYNKAEVQRDFLRYTAQIILKDLRNNNDELLNQFLVNTKDRKYQIWERNALTIDIWSEPVLEEKLQYIHENPLRAGLCKRINNYRFSSARFYETSVNDFDFLSHYRYG